MMAIICVFATTTKELLGIMRPNFLTAEHFASFKIVLDQTVLKNKVSEYDIYCYFDLPLSTTHWCIIVAIL